MSDDEIKTADAGECNTSLVRTISWKQGCIIAMGVPILILPSLYDVTDTLWAFSIVMWCISVMQGFAQNFAIGEVSATFGCAGIPGSVQLMFTDKKIKSRINKGRFLSGFASWCYWFTWTPVIPIFTIMCGTYLREFVEPLSGIHPIVLNLCLGAMIFLLLIAVSLKGLAGGARLGLILALVTILPLVAICSMTFFNGSFEVSHIVEEFLPPEWGWSLTDITMLFGTFALAQWSACAWETAAVYGAEYKDPGKDLPKALLSCGAICFAVYALVAVAVFGVLGVGGVEDAGYATLIPVTIADFGEIGSSIALIMLVAGMVLLIQTAFLGSSRALYTMGVEQHMPAFFARKNRQGTPYVAMVFQACMGLILIPLGSPEMILAASSFGFCLALGFAMWAFRRSRTDPRFKDVARPWRAPRGWYWVSTGLMIYQFFILIPGLAYWSYRYFGISSVILGGAILVCYIPFWFMLQKHYDRGEKGVSAETDAEVTAAPR
jgi:amino acid transporter